MPRHVTSKPAALRRPRPLKPVRCATAEQAVNELERFYARELDQVRAWETSLSQTERARSVEPPRVYYPQIAFTIDDEPPHIDAVPAYGYCRQGPGEYRATIAQPALFRRYLIDQITRVMKSHQAAPTISLGDQQIPLELVLNHSAVPEWAAARLPGVQVDTINLPDCSDGEPRLTVLDGLASHYCIARLFHYTRSAPENFQSFVLLTNYAMHVDEFRQYAHSVVGQGVYTELVEPPNVDESHHIPQMPAYHLKRPDGLGITLINIGVGSSNAVTIVEKLAPLRPHAICMIGHCAGVRKTQRLGGYVVGEAYYRDGDILTDELPRDVPIPAIVEINQAFRGALLKVYGFTNGEHKNYFERAVIASTVTRNWETKRKTKNRILRSRAAAVDMETAFVAAACLVYQIPYGALLCISDMPLHGKAKLPGTAQQFYQDSKRKQVLAAVKAMEMLAENPLSAHSRKLRHPTFASAFR